MDRDTLQDADARDALKRIPLFAATAPGGLALERLGGLTNRNYLVSAPDGRYVLRLAGAGTEHYIDRAAEFRNASIAARAGVNAQVLYFDVTDGTMVSRYLERTVTMSPQRFRRPGAPARAARALRRLHDCGEAFSGRFELFAQIDHYLNVLEGKGAALPEGFAEARARGEEIRGLLKRRSLPEAPCHCDPLPENFLDDGERMYVIDFEYAGNNDPMWDLGDLSVEAGFDSAQDQELLQSYFEGAVPPKEAARMLIYKAMCDLLWTLWGVVQHVDGNPSEDFRTYAVNRLERCTRLMASETYRHQVEVLRAED